jgi:phosphonate transport system permease protein
MVGAGGIAVTLHEVIRSVQYPQTCAVLIIPIGAPTIIDVISAYLRKRVT